MMASPAAVSDPNAPILEALRQRYEAQGFSFTSNPRSAELPSFFGAYQPDAIARKGDLNIAIEVKRRRPNSNEKPLQEIRRLFEAHPDWQLKAVFMGSDPFEPSTIALAKPADIWAQVAEAEQLNLAGHRRAAFLMAWSLLEAAFRSVGDPMAKPLKPGTVIQGLAMNGNIEPETEHQLRRLVDLRNRIVHGDVSVEPTSEHVQTILTAIQSILSDHG